MAETFVRNQSHLDKLTTELRMRGEDVRQADHQYKRSGYVLAKFPHVTPETLEKVLADNDYLVMSPKHMQRAQDA